MVVALARESRELANLVFLHFVLHKGLFSFYSAEAK